MQVEPSAPGLRDAGDSWEGKGQRGPPGPHDSLHPLSRALWQLLQKQSLGSVSEEWLSQAEPTGPECKAFRSQARSREGLEDESAM